MGAIRMSAMSPEQLGQLKPLLERSRQKPYRFLLSDLPDAPDSLWLSEIAAFSQGQQGQAFVAMHESETVGLVAYSDLPWDTRVIGTRMGALKYIVVEPDCPRQPEVVERLLNQVIDWAISHGVEFLLCKTYTDDISTIHALERSGFLLMDTLLDYVYCGRADPPHDVFRPPLFEGSTIRLAKEDDVEGLAAVAHASFHHHFGRFHADERIPKGQAIQVYEEWIRASCKGYADWILVAAVNGRIAGYSVWKKPSTLEQSVGMRLGHYSIGVVHPDYHGLGLFSALTRAGMELFDGIADYIEGPTHVNNYPVQRAYSRLLWRICDARHSFHKWLR